MNSIKRSPGLGSWRYHSLNIPGGDLDFAVKRESLSDTQWTQAWPLCVGRGVVVLYVDSWESFPHFDSKRSWTLPFHVWKEIPVRRLLACLPSGLGASQTTPTFLGPSPLFPNLLCSKMARYKKLPVGMPGLQRAVTSVHKGSFVQRLDGDTSGFQAQRTKFGFS